MNIERKPAWLRVPVSHGSHFGETSACIAASGVATVCESAKCPNRGDCWSRGTATFMILGEVCTRNCSFCAVKHGRPDCANADEPKKVAEAIAKMRLKCAVITSVTRDDLPDGGASHWADVVRAVRAAAPETKIEILTPDFRGEKLALKTVFESRPDVFSHNAETVRRLQKSVRTLADFDTSLGVLKEAKDFGLRTKTSIMLGLGETRGEIEQCLREIRAAGADILTVGQYLRPSAENVPVARWVEPEEFARWGEFAKSIGFSHVKSAPLVRSSFRAHEVFEG